MSYARVTLVPGQQVFSLAAEESILEAAQRQGINLPHSCRGGQCSSCRARILSGRIHYPSGQPPGITAQEQRDGYALMCQARALTSELTIEIRQTKVPEIDTEIRSLPCRVEQMESRAPDVTAVFLRLPRTENFNFVAGQYIDIVMPGNQRRSFSLANPPHDAALLELHIRRVRKGEFTQQLLASMHEKVLLRIEGPLGQFRFQEASPRPGLMVGGGTGYAPLRSMLRHLLEQGHSQPLEFYWGVRSKIDLYAAQEVLEWTQQYPNLRFTPVLSDPLPEDHWSGRNGLVHAAVIADHPRLADYDVYVAGPPAMIETIRQEFGQAGLPPHQLFFDSY